MTTRLDSNVFVILGTDLAQLKRRSHFTVEFVLLLCHLNVILRSVMHQVTEISVYTFTIWIQVTVKIEGYGKTLVYMPFRKFLVLCIVSQSKDQALGNKARAIQQQNTSEY